MNALRRQKSYAWAQYFKSMEETHRDQLDILRLHERLLADEDATEEIPLHFLKEFTYMAKKLHKELSCPVCLEVIKYDNLKILCCGHKHCEDCFRRIEKCSLCRRKVKK